MGQGKGRTLQAIATATGVAGTAVLALLLLHEAGPGQPTDIALLAIVSVPVLLALLACRSRPVLLRAAGITALGLSPMLFSGVLLLLVPSVLYLLAGSALVDESRPAAVPTALIALVPSALSIVAVTQLLLIDTVTRCSYESRVARCAPVAPPGRVPIAIGLALLAVVVPWFLATPRRRRGGPTSPRGSADEPPPGPPASHPRPWTVSLVADYLGAANVVVAALLLTSLAGAAVIPAPVTIPMLMTTSLLARRPGLRWGAAIVAGLTMFEVVWMGISLVSRGAVAGAVGGATVGTATIVGLRVLAAFGTEPSGRWFPRRVDQTSGGPPPSADSSSRRIRSSASSASRRES